MHRAEIHSPQSDAQPVAQPALHHEEEVHGPPSSTAGGKIAIVTALTKAPTIASPRAPWRYESHTKIYTQTHTFFHRYGSFRGATPRLPSGMKINEESTTTMTTHTDRQTVTHKDMHKDTHTHSELMKHTQKNTHTHKHSLIHTHPTAPIHCIHTSDTQ